MSGRKGIDSKADSFQLHHSIPEYSDRTGHGKNFFHDVHYGGGYSKCQKCIGHFAEGTTVYSHKKKSNKKTIRNGGDE